MVRNINVYDKHVKKYMKEHNEGRNTNNPAHKKMLLTY
jgi:hypothetical protein